MKTATISELKTHLSRYLRMVRRGERIIVLDRKESVAELVPPPAATASAWDRLERDGRIHRGTQDWSSLEISPLRKSIPIQEILGDVRDEGS